MDRFDPFVKYADVYGDIINWEKDPMNKPRNQNKYFFSDGKTYYEQICKMLRLMSVFKEAFNQIYSNEDEISEAWENFVNNLSASVVEGSEPDVTLTWTDDSVNFEFTMVPGVPGEQGVGITSISFNSDYTMTITLSDGNTYTSMSLKGETGPQGPQGETGSGLQILDVYPTLADLQSAHPTGQPGDAYQVGSEGNYTLYIWSSSQSAWVPAGSLGTVSPSLSNPLMDGTASAGSLNQYSRGDHVHPSDTSRASKEELDALIKTSQALIDQSFTCRESPAIQDGLARIDKFKGNTLRWNQLIRNGNFADTTNWSAETGATLSISNNIATISSTTANNGIRHYLLNPLTVNHKYLVKAEFNVPTEYRCVIGTGSAQGLQFEKLISDINTWTEVSGVGTCLASTTAFYCFVRGATYENVKVRNIMFFDLTEMFGAGNEPSTAEEFTSLFSSIPYYEYNTGTLLSFNGSELKTVGKNQIANIVRGFFSAGSSAISVDNDSESFVFYAIKGKTYVASSSITLNRNAIARCDTPNLVNGSPVYDATNFGNNAEKKWTATWTGWTVWYIYNSRNEEVENSVQVEIGSAPTEYEPYKSSTLSLPVLTYFPTGMKSAGPIYDELTDNKATARVRQLILDGTQTPRLTGVTANQVFSYDNLLVSDPCKTVNTNITSIYEIGASYATIAYDSPKVAFSTVTTPLLIFPSGTFNDVSDLLTYLQNNPVPINYELATPVETSVDLDLDFMAYEDGTEQLLPVNGAVPTTSPIIADMSYLSIDDAMEYVLEKLANVPQNTQQILESLEDDVADLQTDVGALQPAVSALQTSVGNINTNIGQLSSTVAGHTSSISDMQSDITDLNTGLSDLEDTVTDNTSRIGTLETDLASTDGQVQSLGSSVSTLSSTVSDQGTELGEIDSIIQDISNNPVISALGSHELGFVAAYVDATLPANTGTRVTIPKPVIFPNNYTPLFIVGMSTGAYNVSICEIPPTFGNSDSVNCRVWNHGSQQTTQITVYILCMRQRQSQ